MAITDRTAREWYAQKPEERGALRIHVKVPSDKDVEDICASESGARCAFENEQNTCLKVNQLQGGAHACWRMTARCPSGGVWEVVP